MKDKIKIFSNSNEELSRLKESLNQLKIHPYRFSYTENKYTDDYILDSMLLKLEDSYHRRNKARKELQIFNESKCLTLNNQDFEFKNQDEQKLMSLNSQMNTADREIDLLKHKINEMHRHQQNIEKKHELSSSVTGDIGVLNDKVDEVTKVNSKIEKEIENIRKLIHQKSDKIDEQATNKRQLQNQIYE